MSDSIDYNELVPLSYRRRLNSQRNKRILEGKLDESGRIVQPFRYVIGLGEKHFKSFEHELLHLTELFPWTKRKHVRFIMSEVILNSQFSMLREVVRKVPEKKKVAGYFYLTIYVNNDFFAAGVEEFGDFFDYYGYLDGNFNFTKFDAEKENYYDSMTDDRDINLQDLSRDKLKLILTTDDMLQIPDESNRLALRIIENATDHDFYISSFFKDDKYMWKRINLRVENQTS